MSGPRTITSAWRPSSATSPASRSTTPARDRLDQHEINGDEMIYLAGHAELVQPRTGRSLAAEISRRGPIGLDPGRSRQRTRAAGELADRRTTASSAGTSQTESGFTCWAGGSSSRSMISATRTHRRTRRCCDALTASFEAHGLRLKPLVARDHEVAHLPVERDALREQRARRVEFLTCGRQAAAGRDAAGCYQPGARRRRAISAGTCFAAGGPASGAVQGSAFLKSFGKPDRLLTCECERSEATTLAQAFQMINGETVRTEARVAVEPDRQAPGGRRKLIPRFSSEFYLTAVCREPTPEELTAIKAHLSSGARSAGGVGRCGLGAPQ